jgi:hypothetical protein
MDKETRLAEMRAPKDVTFGNICISRVHNTSSINSITTTTISIDHMPYLKFKQQTLWLSALKHDRINFEVCVFSFP